MTIEIGTSDFRTQAGQVPGIFIEPVKYYFDRLPECTKENVAISNHTGEIRMYYMDDYSIKKFDLPNWVRGCNSMSHVHQTVKNLLDSKGIQLDVVSSSPVPVVRIKSIIDKHGVTEIDFLKVDTEGHDCIILNDYLDTVDIMPRKIQFEANELSNQQDVDAMIDRLTGRGYHCFKHKGDVIAILG